MKVEKEEKYTIHLNRNELIQLWNIIVIARANGNIVTTEKYIELLREHIEL